jgi:hypothetical protein
MIKSCFRHIFKRMSKTVTLMIFLSAAIVLYAQENQESGRAGFFI